MSWQWLDQRTIRHTDGHTIELKSGSWKAPMDIEPRFASVLNSVTSAMLIRTGLEFAASTIPGVSKSTRDLQSATQNKSGNKPGNMSKPRQRTRPVLSLKKKKITS